MSAQANLEKLGLVLPPPPRAVGVYRPCLIAGNLCFTSGHGPLHPDGTMTTGCVGRDADVQQGYEAARQTGLALLSTLKQNLGTLDRVKRVVKLLGMVWCTEEFKEHPAVINGCSELFAQVFGEDHGIGARSAVGMNSLPLGMMVEIEGIFEIRP